MMVLRVVVTVSPVFVDGDDVPLLLTVSLYFSSGTLIGTSISSRDLVTWKRDGFVGSSKSTNIFSALEIGRIWQERIGQGYRKMRVVEGGGGGGGDRRKEKRYSGATRRRKKKKIK